MTVLVSINSQFKLWLIYVCLINYGVNLDTKARSSSPAHAQVHTGGTQAALTRPHSHSLTKSHSLALTRTRTLLHSSSLTLAPRTSERETGREFRFGSSGEKREPATRQTEIRERKVNSSVERGRLRKLRFCLPFCSFFFPGCINIASVNVCLRWDHRRVRGEVFDERALALTRSGLARAASSSVVTEHAVRAVSRRTLPRTRGWGRLNCKSVLTHNHTLPVQALTS